MDTVVVIASFCVVGSVPSLVLCLLCHRHRVLFWLGGMVLVAAGLSVWMFAEAGKAGAETARAAMFVISLPTAANGLVLLVGGAVRRRAYLSAE